MDEFLSRALPVGSQKFENINLDNPATTAEEYLSRVRYEAKRCPDVVVAEVQTKPTAITAVLKTEDQVVSTLPWNVPSVEWQREQSAIFSDIRHRLNLHQRDHVKDTEENKPVMPRLRDELGWCKYCLGVQFHDKVLSAISSTGEEITAHFSDDEEARACLPEDGSPKPPLVSTMMNMNQPMLQQVLDYHIHWLKLTGFTIGQGCWLYALLACLAKPLYPDSAASIREMARSCRSIRLTLENADDERLPSLNLLISLVANYFGQGDLMDKG